jgi:molybdate transport system ATP-binding protein
MSLDQDIDLHIDISQSSPMLLQGSFSCKAGQLLALVGPSGAGKTSMLRALAGLLQPAVASIRVGGDIWCDTEQGIHMPAQQRHVGLVFQNYALMPHMSAAENVALAMLHLPKSQRMQQASDWLNRMGLTADQQQRQPASLSGGQQQRVALARALARQPRLLLLDEPFSAVDHMSRRVLFSLIAELRRDLRIPIVLVTHDLNEARQLADKLVVMDAGQVLQEGTPAHIYRSPRNARVADLVGIPNRFHGRWLGHEGPHRLPEGFAWLEWLALPDAPSGLPLVVKDKGRLKKTGQAVNWVIQGDGFQVNDFEPRDTSQDPESLVLQARLSDLRSLGEISMATLALQLPQGVQLQLTLSGAQRQHLQPAQLLSVRMDCRWIHVMPVRH